MKPQIGVGGFAIAQSLVAFALIAIAVVVFTQYSIGQRFFEARLDRSLLGQRILTGTAIQLQGADFDAVAAMNPAPKCLLAGALDPAVVADPTQTVVPGVNLQKRITMKGDPKADGEMCLEVTRVTPMASGTILEVELTAYWQAPVMSGAAPVLVTKKTMFRKVKW